METTKEPTKLQRDSLVDKAAKEIIHRIYDNTFKLGERLPAERDLCVQLDISRGTLRSALERLKKLGILDIRSGSGAYVKRLDNAKIPERYIPPSYFNVHLDEILTGRRAIELAAVRDAAGKIGKRTLKKMEKLIDSMENHQTHIDEFIYFDMQYHQEIIDASDNKVLRTAYDSIYDFIKYSQIYTSFKKNEMENTIAHHRKILSALAEHNPGKASKMLEHHFNEMTEYIEQQ